MRKLILLSLVFGAAVLSQAADEPPRFVLIVADGLGQGALGWALSEDESEKKGRLKNLRNFLARSRASVVLTHSGSAPVTDSAAAATAMACGIKTNNRAIGMDSSGRPCRSVAELAKDKGISLGFVTTAPSWDATIAAFSAHALDRKDKDKIVQDQKNLGPQVLAGGETEVPGIKKAGDRVDLPRLADYAFQKLSGDPDGFFLLLETEDTDETAHANDLDGFLQALRELDALIKTCLEFQRAYPATVIALTSDHDTGGLNFFAKTKGGKTKPRWATKDHTAAPVAFHLLSPAPYSLKGFMDNTEIAGIMKKFLGLP